MVLQASQPLKQWEKWAWAFLVMLEFELVGSKHLIRTGKMASTSGGSTPHTPGAMHFEPLCPPGVCPFNAYGFKEGTCIHNQRLLLRRHSH